jgi:ASC-1-like (ASCH) protein
MSRWLLKFASYKQKNDIFDAVRSGKKSIETRPFNPQKKHNYSKIIPGDTLVFYSLDTHEKLEREAVYTRVYKSVVDMVENEPVEKILPGIKSKSALLKVYEELKSKWGKTYAQKLEKYGIVAVGFK